MVNCSKDGKCYIPLNKERKWSITVVLRIKKYQPGPSCSRFKFQMTNESNMAVFLLLVLNGHPLNTGKPL